jgi:hypothetical protein
MLGPSGGAAPQMAPVSAVLDQAFGAREYVTFDHLVLVPWTGGGFFRAR